MNGLKKTFAIAAAVSMVCLSSAGAMAAQNKLIVRNAGNTADAFVVDDRGFVGIGTNTPSAAFNLVGSFLSTSQFRSHFVGTNTNGGGGLYLLHNNGTTAALTLPTVNNRVGAVNFGSVIGTLATPTSIPLGGAITVRAEAAWSAGSAPSFITFDTSANAQISPVEKMRLTSTGNLGIGNAAPAAKLDVSGGIRLNSTGAQPACSSTNRGTFWLNVAVNPNVLQICAEAGGTPIWRTVSLL